MNWDDAPETMKWTLNFSYVPWDRHIYIYERTESASWDLIYFMRRQSWVIQSAIDKSNQIGEYQLPKNWAPA